MWIPRDPEVFGQPMRPTASRASCATSATSRICGHATPGTGSRSTRSSSGWSRSSARTGWGLRSMQPRLATHARPAASSRTISSAVRPDGKVSVAVRIQSGRLSGARFWKNGLTLGAVDEALERHRPAARPAQGAVGDREVVRDEVELRVAGFREVDLVRVGDRDLAAADLEELLSGGMVRCYRESQVEDRHGNPDLVPQPRPPLARGSARRPRRRRHPDRARREPRRRRQYRSRARSAARRSAAARCSSAAAGSVSA